MGDIYKDCYQCGKNCINTQFCADGGSFDSSNLQLPRTLKIRIVANPDFWGFGSVSSNTLIEGWGTFTNGYFDFFDGFDEDHTSFKDCGAIVLGPYTNEQRPDVKYRSIYDPENDDSHYPDEIIRGGAEGYLLDRAATYTTDNSSCDETNPNTVFKFNPADYGTFPKILFNNKIYKNITGGWRIEECSACYSNAPIDNDLRVYDCSGSPKQHIAGDDKFSTLYDPFQSRCIDSSFTDESDCNPDGTIAGEYAGAISGILRDTGVSPFIQYNLQYNSSAASGISNGQNIGIKGTSGNHDGVITAFDVTHQDGYTSLKAVGSNDNTNFVDNTGTWIAFDTYDPNMCCGGAAYGVDPALMNLVNSPLYHIDIGRVFNNPKNKIYSNRIDRTYNGLNVESQVPDGTARKDYAYVSVNEDGHALLVESGAIHEIDLSCQTDIWDPKVDYIYKLAGEYSTSSGVGAEALSTDSGFYPLFAKELPYFGAFDEVDRWDNTTRQMSRGTREVNKNATCYTKNGSLTVFPDCLTQWTQYTNCDPATKYTLNNVPRIALSYKGCDFDDPCSFDDSGRPWTAGASGHPSNMNDLIRGFGGQEVQMYVNLGTARGAEIKRAPCCCDEPCPGTAEPTFVQIPSPVTFPCFPKFDLYPEKYGCKDPLYYFGIMEILGLDTSPSGQCAIPYYDACDPIQPYTTYGYIRNLCGKETNSRRAVIDSLAEKLHTGGYKDTAHTDNTVEPMYVGFQPDVPDCCSPSGFPAGGTECDSDLISFTTYGEGAAATLTTDATGGITYNISSPGNGYLLGGAGTFTTPVLLPTPGAFDGTLSLTFSGPDSSLTSISHPTSGSPHDTTFPLTIVPGQSGIAGTGGFSYNACNASGLVHYWGLTDSMGRLGLPYFRTEPKTTRICGGEPNGYIGYSASGTIVKDWPKDKVPFLVEIDHEEYCLGCSTAQMPVKNLTLTMSSLDTSYSHNQDSASNNSVYGIYGWNHCKYPGTSVTPFYHTTSGTESVGVGLDARDVEHSADTWNKDFCAPGDGLAEKYGQVYTGQTCQCADGQSVTMAPRVLQGTNIPIGYKTSGNTYGGNPENSYTSFGSCGLVNPLFDYNTQDKTGPTSAKAEVLANHKVYFSASISCLDEMYSNPFFAEAARIGGDGLNIYGDMLSELYGCGDGCSTSFPAPNHSPTLNLDFFFVKRDQASIFESMNDISIAQNIKFLQHGLTYTDIVPGPGDPVPPTAGGLTGHITPDGGDLETWPVGCEGSKIYLYSCMLYNAIDPNSSHGNFDGIHKDFDCEQDVLDSLAAVTGSVLPDPQYALHNDCTPHYGHHFGYWDSPMPCSTPLTSGGCYGDLKADVLAACSGESMGDFYSCWEPQYSRCCQDVDDHPPNSLAANRLEDWNFPRTNGICFCDGMTNQEVMREFEWKEAISGDNSGEYSWYCDAQFYAQVGFSGETSALAYYWSGENLPGMGDIGPLKIAQGYVDNPYAGINRHKQPSASFGSVAFHYGEISSQSITIEPYCSYHTGPNSTNSGVGAELFEPFRGDKFLNFDFGNGSNLVPVSCEAGAAYGKLDSGSPFYSTCGTPKPFDTYSGGIGSTINVKKKACWPEIMTVHKIECESDHYKLHVSREYFEHDRLWYEIQDYNPANSDVPRLGLITGGQTSKEYTCAETYPVACADPAGDGGTPSNTADASFALYMMTPADSVSPVYPSSCATGTEPFYQTNESVNTYRFGSHTTSEEHESGCLYYPAISGQQFWNFYNLLYDLGYPNSSYLTDAGGIVYEPTPDPYQSCNRSFPFNLATITEFVDLDPVFASSGDLQYAHSCVQDSFKCGGDLWCNKEFFPRKSYNTNTRITKFAALSICEQNAQFEAPVWYEGHETTWDTSPNKQILATGPFIDACDDDAAVLLRSPVGIDDNIITIPLKNEGETSTSIETLMGIIHPGFKSNLNEKTCIYADSGECLSYLPEHNNRTLKDITFAADEYGYYLNDVVTSGSDNCLFTPFKIMMDVECCFDRIGHKGTTKPTFLSYVAKVPASVCEGWISDPDCACNNTCDAYDDGASLSGLTQIQGIEFVEFQKVVPGDGDVGCFWYQPSTGCPCDATVTEPTHLYWGWSGNLENSPHVEDALALVGDGCAEELTRYQIFGLNGADPRDYLTPTTVSAPVRFGMCDPETDGTEEWGCEFAGDAACITPGEFCACHIDPWCDLDDNCTPACGDTSPGWCYDWQTDPTSPQCIVSGELADIPCFSYKGKPGQIVYSTDIHPNTPVSPFCMDMVVYKGKEYRWINQGMTPTYYAIGLSQCCDDRMGHPNPGLSIGANQHLADGHVIYEDFDLTATDEYERPAPILDHSKKIHGTNCCTHSFCDVYGSLIELKPGKDETGASFGGDGYVINQTDSFQEPTYAPTHPDLFDATIGIDRAQHAGGCVSLDSFYECPYRSNILIEITEQDDTPAYMSAGTPAYIDPVYRGPVGTDPEITDQPEDLEPSDILAMVFIDESSPYSGGWGRDSALYLFDYDLQAWKNYMNEESLDSAICLMQPLPPEGQDKWSDERNLVPRGYSFPGFVHHSEMGRNEFGVNPSVQLAEMQAAFLATAGTTVPRVLGIFVDISGSMRRSTIEPAIDEFIAWYKAWSLELTGVEGCVYEYGTRTERWLAEALIALKQADASCPE